MTAMRFVDIILVGQFPGKTDSTPQQQSVWYKFSVVPLSLKLLVIIRIAAILANALIYLFLPHLIFRRFCLEALATRMS